MFDEIIKYSGFFQNAIKQKYAYKFKVLVFSISPLIFMLIQYYLWKAIFESNNGILFNVSMVQYLSYVGIGLIVENVTLCQQDLLVGEEVKSGNVAMSLLKPLNYGAMVFARHLGDKIGELISIVPVFLFVILRISINTVSIVVLLEFLISLILAFVIMFFLCYITGLLAFWATNCWGLHFLRKSLSFVFSGQAIAIEMYFMVGKSNITYLPFSFLSAEFIKQLFQALGYISYCLPFQAMYYTPSGIYTGIISGQQNILIHMFLQLIWIIFMMFIIKLIWKKAEKRISILGG
ncbi:ABC-2 family transporter protein [Clostridium algoriphilum]|uniref:ABC transporter permease n=1 Tax=Clostridium algoriphilum TaxID=198347 RepID=UPI001CF16684|nr:ABC-2 family transporter protein [Clostridium algoriphilum]MCB2295714.1 ABC-2 family transporter protein [Clostridium algoriphilum]